MKVLLKMRQILSHKHVSGNEKGVTHRRCITKALTNHITVENMNVC